MPSFNYHKTIIGAIIMKLSEETKSILKNFSDINQNIMIKTGKELKTISTMKTF